MTRTPKYTGLIPAAGRATRLPGLPCSKEIYPLKILDDNGKKDEVPVCKCLIDSYRIAGINNVIMIIREGKEDIPKQLGNGEQYGVNINYLYAQKPYGPSYTLDEAFPQIQDQFIAVGFPDILFNPSNAFKALIEKQQHGNADVVLGLFKAPDTKKMDMVAFDQSGNIQSIQIKPQQTSLHMTWILAVWNPAFSAFMHKSLQNLLSEFETKQRSECHVGTIFQLALKEQISFDCVCFDEGDLIDIGTPEDLAKFDPANSI